MINLIGYLLTFSSIPLGIYGVVRMANLQGISVLIVALFMFFVGVSFSTIKKSTQKTGVKDGKEI